MSETTAPAQQRGRLPRLRRPRAAWIIRRPLEVRTDGGWTLYVPAPVALIGLASLFLVGILSAMDPVRIRSAVVDRRADDVLKWETGERRRAEKSLEELERPLRVLRREALVRGIPLEGTLATSSCEGILPGEHLKGHLEEAARLVTALTPRTAAPDSQLPSRLPLAVSDTDEWFLTEDRWMPDAIRVTSGKGPRVDPFTGKAKQHKGLDISAPVGTPVIAPGGGTIVFAGSIDPNVDHFRSLLGNYVLIDHGKTGYSSIYGHLSLINVKAGQVVRAGDKLGEVGTTGRSTAPHLHYQLMKDGQAIDPLSFITDVVLVHDGKAVWYAR